MHAFILYARALFSSALLLFLAERDGYSHFHSAQANPLVVCDMRAVMLPSSVQVVHMLS